MTKKNKDLELKVIELYGRGLKAGVISRILNAPRTTVYKIIQRNRVPEVKYNVKINELISSRLLYFCDDIELLSKRIAIEIIYKKPKKIIIPKRLQHIVQKEKINKIVSILDKVDIKCNLEFA
jgi:hypothetical protein